MTVYYFCQACDQRKAEVLFVGTKCTACHKRSEAIKPMREFTEEEYEKMGEM